MDAEGNCLVVSPCSTCKNGKNGVQACIMRRHNARLTSVTRDNLSANHRQCVKPDQAMTIFKLVDRETGEESVEFAEQMVFQRPCEKCMGLKDWTGDSGFGAVSGGGTPHSQSKEASNKRKAPTPSQTKSPTPSKGKQTATPATEPSKKKAKSTPKPDASKRKGSFGKGSSAKKSSTGATRPRSPEESEKDEEEVVEDDQSAEDMHSTPEPKRSKKIRKSDAPARTTPSQAKSDVPSSPTTLSIVAIDKHQSVSEQLEAAKAAEDIVIGHYQSEMKRLEKAESDIIAKITRMGEELNQIRSARQMTKENAVEQRATWASERERLAELRLQEIIREENHAKEAKEALWNAAGAEPTESEQQRAYSANMPPEVLEALCLDQLVKDDKALSALPHVTAANHTSPDSDGTARRGDSHGTGSSARKKDGGGDGGTTSMCSGDRTGDARLESDKMKPGNDTSNPGKDVGATATRSARSVRSSRRNSSGSRGIAAVAEEESSVGKGVGGGTGCRAATVSADSKLPGPESSKGMENTDGEGALEIVDSRGGVDHNDDKGGLENVDNEGGFRGASVAIDDEMVQVETDRKSSKANGAEAQQNNARVEGDGSKASPVADGREHPGNTESLANKGKAHGGPAGDSSGVFPSSRSAASDTAISTNDASSSCSDKREDDGDGYGHESSGELFVGDGDAATETIARQDNDGGSANNVTFSSEDNSMEAAPIAEAATGRRDANIPSPPVEVSNVEEKNPGVKHPNGVGETGSGFTAERDTNGGNAQVETSVVAAASPPVNGAASPHSH